MDWERHTEQTEGNPCLAGAPFEIQLVEERELFGVSFKKQRKEKVQYRKGKKKHIILGSKVK